MARFTVNDIRVQGEKINHVYYNESSSQAREMADDLYSEIAMERDESTRKDLEYELRRVTGFDKR